MSTQAAGELPGRRTLKVVCPHDCPDTCVMTVDVEGGRIRAFHIMRNPDKLRYALDATVRLI